MQILSTQVNETSPQLYNALDCCLTAEISNNLNPLIKKDPNSQLIYNFERALQAPAMEMMLRGVRVDPSAREKAIMKLTEDRDHVEFMLSSFVGALSSDKDYVYNKKLPNSRNQLMELFYEKLNIPTIKSFVKGDEKSPMNRDTLEKLYQYYHARPFISCILAFRDYSKQLQVLNSEVDNDWRMRTSFNIAGTTTGRWSSSKAFTGSGTNFQNITEDLRYIFIADEGCKIGGIDKEQAESREVGYLCGILFDDWDYLNACESGDLHTYVARLCWPELGWTEDKDANRSIAEQAYYRHYSYRDMAKRCGHGTNYYGKPFTISSILKIPIKNVQEFQRRYFEAFPAIGRMHRWVAEQLQTKGYLINVFGRRRDFFDRSNSEETLRGAIAYLFQSATADDMNLGLWRLWKYMGHKIQLLLQLHDAVYFQFNENEYDETEIFREAQSLLNVRLVHKDREFIVPTDPKSGYNLGNRWKYNAQGKKIEVNPKGLDKVKFKETA